MNEYFVFRSFIKQQEFTFSKVRQHKAIKSIKFRTPYKIKQKKTKSLFCTTCYGSSYMYIIISVPLYVSDIVTDPDTASILLEGHVLLMFVRRRGPRLQINFTCAITIVDLLSNKTRLNGFFLYHKNEHVMSFQ